MDRIEEPADAEVMLQNSLRVLAMPAQEQIALFEPFCVACCVRTTFSGWEDQFADAPFAKGMTRPQKSALGKVRQACEAIRADPAFECNENSYVCESPQMGALRQGATKALASFGWSPGTIDRTYVPGTQECGERLRRLFEQRKQDEHAVRRMEAAKPRFHAATLQMHGHLLARNRARIAEVDRWEEKHGIQLPAAVREWYEFEGNDLWERIRPRDNVQALDELEPLQRARVRETSVDGQDDETFIYLFSRLDTGMELVEPVDSFRYLIVCSDGDVGIPCLVRVDGTDDPPAFIWPEGGGDLEFISPRYSVFQFDWLASEGLEDYIIIKVDDRLPTNVELDQLRSKFSVGPVSEGGWPGWHHRFFNEGALVACGHDPYASTGEKPFWEIRAASNEALLDVLRVLWPIADLAKKLERKVMSLGVAVDSLNQS